MKIREWANKENEGKKIRIYCGTTSITRTGATLISSTPTQILNGEVIRERTTGNGSVIHVYIYPSIKIREMLL